MGSGIMHIEEVELGGEGGVSGAGKEIQASIFAQNGICQLDDIHGGSEYQHIVIALSIAECHQLCLGVNACCVEIQQGNTLTGSIVIDIIFGSIATLVGAVFTRKFKDNLFLAILPSILSVSAAKTNINAAISLPYGTKSAR